MGTPVDRVGKKWRHSFLDFRDLAIPRGSRPSPAQEGSAESGPLAADPITYSGHMVRVNLGPLDQGSDWVVASLSIAVALV